MRTPIVIAAAMAVALPVVAYAADFAGGAIKSAETSKAGSSPTPKG